MLCCCLCRAHKRVQAALFKAGGCGGGGKERRENIYDIRKVVTRHLLQTNHEGHLTLRAYKCEPRRTNSAVSLAEMNLRLSPHHTHEAERLHRLPFWCMGQWECLQSVRLNAIYKIASNNGEVFVCHLFVCQNSSTAIEFIQIYGSDLTVLPCIKPARVRAKWLYLGLNAFDVWIS